MLKDLPNKPGIYRFYDKHRKLLYIGKAKNLSSRVKSYFTKSADLSPAKQLMVKKIKHIEFTIVNNEKEALLLEANLIKKYQPKYNIELKDDKSWLYIKITSDKYPQVVVTRKLKDKPKKNEKYFVLIHDYTVMKNKTASKQNPKVAITIGILAMSFFPIALFANVPV